MVLFPNAKINLGLSVLHKRGDGFHEIESLMLPIPLYDILEILPANEFQFVQTGIVVDGLAEDNLCVKAYHLLNEKYAISPLYIHLRKQVPMGAGLGGGSSDAAFVIKGINDLLQLGMTFSEMETMSAQLGSDCPFFIKNEAQIAKGRGELLTPFQLDLSTYFLKIVNPGLHVGTREAYQGIVFQDRTKTIAEILQQPIETWKDELKNDFERSVFQIHPVLQDIKNKLYDDGAVYVAMSGSGSTLFALYKEKPSKSFGDTSYLEEVLQLY